MMPIAEVNAINAKNPIPVYGIESNTEKQAVPNAPVNKANSKKVIKVDDLNAQIAERAYFKAEARGFSPSDALADWLAAEAEMHNESR